MAAVLDRVYLCMWLLIEKESVNQDLKLHAAVSVDLYVIKHLITLCFQVSLVLICGTEDTW